ncbi:MAG: phenylalanine--tRNA ligase subunit beta, partial [Chloroflexota bacterium]|nr:phenylalanine--tRNA ligase subunit beta [Chloroflexota bacterium]
MKLPLSWLRDYVEIKLPVAELAHRLTMAGVEVGGVTTIGDWESCYVGRVLSVERHPNADRLTVCAVDLGAEQIQVVCGAPNVAAGQRICFAKVGASLFNTHTGKREPLKAARIRGVVSEGMICSAKELGIGEDHAGIVVLAPDAPVGVPLNDYLGDAILDLEVTPNRSDCLSALGIAHEVAALTGAAVREPDRTYPEAGEPIETLARVEVLNPDLCYRYTASLVTGIRIGPSPQWLQERLLKAGQRPINNVVDVTNYVMLEYGQPLHAFDYELIAGKKIIVRRAKPGEKLMSLDGVERTLSNDMLVIADAERAVAIAGIMGGANSEVGNSTTTILLESANFNAASIHYTGAKLGLPSEARLRFERG